MLTQSFSRGEGTRLWPLSREVVSQQLLGLLTGERTMLQADSAASLRFQAAAPVVVCNDAPSVFSLPRAAKACWRHWIARAVVLEPFGRNTASCHCVGSRWRREDVIGEQGADDPELLVLPADHVIRMCPPFKKQSGSRCPAVSRATGYSGSCSSPRRATATYNAAVEWPTASTESPGLLRNLRWTALSRFLQSGDYLWKQRMFMFRPAVICGAGGFAPQIVSRLSAAFDGGKSDLDLHG